MNKDAYDLLLEGIRTEFVEEAEDNFKQLDILLENLRSEQEDAEAAMIKIQRPAHSMKGSAGLADFPLVGVIMHKLEDYMSGLERLTPEQIEVVQKYLDIAREYATLEADQSGDAAELLRALPTSALETTEGETVEPENILHALLVVKEMTAGKIFERELNNLGLTVTRSRKPFEAMDMAVRTKPDIIITSGLLDTLDGVDVASALKSMPKTKDIPVCVMTSFDRGHKELEGLPNEVFLLKKNNLADDLTAAINVFELR